MQRGMKWHAGDVSCKFIGEKKVGELPVDIRSNKKVVIIAPIVILLVIGLVLSILFGSQIFAPKYDQNIGTIKTASQEMGGATSTNYMPILAESVNWDSLSDGDREGTARYAVNEAITKAESEGKDSYNVVGMSADGSKPVFLYTAGGETLTLFVGEESVLVPLSS
jgi:hypothetical protein